MRGALGTILLLILIGILVVLILTKIDIALAAERFWYSPLGERMKETGEKTLEAIKKFVTSLEKVAELIENPEKVYLYAHEAEPAKEVVEKKYKVEIKKKDFFITPTCTFDSKGNCKDLHIKTTYLFFINYNFPYKTKIETNCSIETDLEECLIIDANFSKCKISKIDNKGNDILPILISVDYNESNEMCMKDGKVKYLSFTIRPKLEVYVELNSTTTYRALIIRDDVYLSAEEKGVDVYTYLKLDKRNYDRGVYYGLLGYPKVDIARIFTKKFPIIVFKDKVTYDPIIFNIKDLENIKDIEEFKIYLPGYIKILNFENKKCMGKSFTMNTYGFDIKCDKENEWICKIKISKDMLKLYKERDEIIAIPLVLCFDSSVLKDRTYREMNIRAYIKYIYYKEVKGWIDVGK